MFELKELMDYMFTGYFEWDIRIEFIVVIPARSILEAKSILRLMRPSKSYLVIKDIIIKPFSLE